MSRQQNEGPELATADIKAMVMQLADSARRLYEAGDVEGAADAAATAKLYAADANMDPRFYRSLAKYTPEGYRPPKFKFEGKGLKNRLLK